MSTKYEYYDTGLDSDMAVYPPYYETQTFTVNTPHKISAVKLYVARFLKGEPGTVIVQIRTTDGDGKPTSTVLCSGSFNGNDVEYAYFEWIEVALDETVLSTGIKYAIVIMSPDADAYQPIYWASDNSSPTYSGGSRVYSEDEGDTWIIKADEDYYFEEWGNAFFQQTVGQGAITPVGVLGAHIIFYRNVGQGAVALAGTLARNIFKAVGSGSITPTATISRVVKIVVGAGSITPSGVLSTIVRFTQNVGQGAVSIVGTLGLKIALTVGGGAITPASSLLYRLGRNIQITVVTASYRSVNVITALYRKIRGSTTET